VYVEVNSGTISHQQNTCGNGGQQASDSRSARVNPYLPGHHEGWMMGGQETVFHWVSIDENQPIINKTKHPTKGEKKVQFHS
jgi:hypothetical protein